MAQVIIGIGNITNDIFINVEDGRWTAQDIIGVGNGTNGAFVNFEDGRRIAQVIIGIGNGTNNIFCKLLRWTLDSASYYWYWE